MKGRIISVLLVSLIALLAASCVTPRDHLKAEMIERDPSFEDETFWAEADPWLRRFGMNPNFQFYYNNARVKIVVLYWQRYTFGVVLRRFYEYPWEHVGFISEKGWEAVNQARKAQEEQGKQFENMNKPKRLEGL